MRIISKEVLINEKIKAPEVRLIDENGEQMGIVTSKKALELAIDKNLDLVEIAPQAKPPVCKIMDYGKYRFEIAKKEKEQRKNQKVIAVKEIRLTPNIDDHDFFTKVNNAIKFLKSGDKVKVSIRMSGRQQAYFERGIETENKFAESLEELATIEKPAKVEGRNIIMILAPKTAKK